jgi:hypothetical protein
LEFADAQTLSASRGDGTVDKLVWTQRGPAPQTATLLGKSPDLSAAAGLMYAAAGEYSIQ